MALDILREVGLKISTENGQQITSKRAQTVANDSAYSYAFDGHRSIPGSTNQEIDLNGITTGKLIYIEAEAAVNVRLGGAAVDAIEVAPQATGTNGTSPRSTSRRPRRRPWLFTSRSPGCSIPA